MRQNRIRISPCLLALILFSTSGRAVTIAGNPGRAGTLSVRCGLKTNSAATGQGKDRPDLDTDLIGKTLLAGADAVVRYDKVNETIGLESGVRRHEQSAITVLSEKGERDGSVVVYYDKEDPVLNLSASIYDAHGKLLKVVHERDFQDNSYDDEESMFNDMRYKKYQPVVSEYPYTVVVEEESKVRNSLELPAWTPQYHEGLAIEQSSLDLHVKNDISLHFHQQLVGSPETRIGTDNEKIYTWQVKDKKAFKVEPYGPAIESYRPEVLFSPDSFTIKGMRGSCLSWASLGKWEYDNFLKDAGSLPQSTIDQVLALTAHTKVPKEKARLIYAWMQHRTHYVGVQIGIGGIKTEQAKLVDEKGYGDCKGLVNYTRALMQAAGVEALYAEVFAGKIPGKVYPDFSALGFSNHIILCLPFKNDTCWLECTSQEMPFNYEGNFTDNRPAILITPEGGKLVYTHRYPDSGNQQIRQAALTLTAGGDVSGTLTTQFTGLQYEDRDGIKELSEEKRIERFKQIYSINRLEINHCSLDYKKEGAPLLTERLAIEIPQFAEMTDKSMLVQASPFMHTGGLDFSRHKRTVPVVVLRGSMERDSVTYTLPAGYKPESLPEEALHADFGDYSVNATFKGNTILCVSSYQLRSGTWNASRYDDFVRFHQQIKALDELGVRIVPIN